MVAMSANAFAFQDIISKYVMRQEAKGMVSSFSDEDPETDGQWKNVGSPVCESWLPDPMVTPIFEDFAQNRNCSQSQEMQSKDGNIETRTVNVIEERDISYSLAGEPTRIYVNRTGLMGNGTNNFVRNSFSPAFNATSLFGNNVSIGSEAIRTAKADETKIIDSIYKHAEDIVATKNSSSVSPVNVTQRVRVVSDNGIAGVSIASSPPFPSSDDKYGFSFSKEHIYSGGTVVREYTTNSVMKVSPTRIWGLQLSHDEPIVYSQALSGTMGQVLQQVDANVKEKIKVTAQYVPSFSGVSCRLNQSSDLFHGKSPAEIYEILGIGGYGINAGSANVACSGNANYGSLLVSQEISLDGEIEGSSSLSGRVIFSASNTVSNYMTSFTNENFNVVDLDYVQANVIERQTIKEGYVSDLNEYVSELSDKEIWEYTDRHFSMQDVAGVAKIYTVKGSHESHMKDLMDYNISSVIVEGVGRINIDGGLKFAGEHSYVNKGLHDFNIRIYSDNTVDIHTTLGGKVLDRRPITPRSAL